MEIDFLISRLKSLVKLVKSAGGIRGLLKGLNEKIKHDHFVSVLKQEYYTIKKEKNSILEHAGLDERKQKKILLEVMEKRKNIYSGINRQFDDYYTKRSSWLIDILLLVLSSLTLILFIVTFENNILLNRDLTAIITISSIKDVLDLLLTIIEIIIFLVACLIFWYVSLVAMSFLGIDPIVYQTADLWGEGMPDAFGKNRSVRTIQSVSHEIKGVEFRKELRRAIRFHLREIVNSLYFSLSYDITLSDVRGGGLEEGYDRLLEVDTEARRYVQKMISKMSRGSFGIAGPRGTGKTTLLHSMQEQDEGGKETMYVHLSAPVAYDAREFILYLYSEVCRAAVTRLDPQGRMQPRPSRKWSFAHFFEGLFRWETILAFGILLAIVYYHGGMVLNYYMETLKDYNIAPETVDIIIKYNLFAFLAALLFLSLIFNLLGKVFGSLLSFWSPEVSVSVNRSILIKVYSELQKIKYQQTLTDAKGGKLNFSILEASSDQSSTFQEYEMSLPEVTNAYRKFIKEMTGSYRFIIAIDEMDKIEDSLQAQAFLNDLKNILNLENCFYLVSVSENAMSAFELRGLPFRDAFDSTFDEVVHLSYIDLKQAREIISRRLIGFPEPFLQLAYALSGGLPRDLIRVTRKMVMPVTESDLSRLSDKIARKDNLFIRVDLTSQNVLSQTLRDIANSLLQENMLFREELTSQNVPSLTLRDVAYSLLREDIVNKINAARYQVQDKGLNIKAGSYMVALDMLETNISVENLNKQGKGLVKSARGFTQKNGLVEIQTLLYNLGIYMIYISTLLALFTQSRTQDDFKLAADNHLDQLVTARQRIGLSSDYALILVNQFRKTFRMPVVKA